MENQNNNDNRNNGPEQREHRPGVDVGAIFHGLWAEGNRRRLVLRHQGETVLRLPMTIVVIILLVLLWQSPFLLVLGIALIFFLRLQVVFERRSNAAPPPVHRD